MAIYYPKPGDRTPGPTPENPIGGVLHLAEPREWQPDDVAMLTDTTALDRLLAGAKAEALREAASDVVVDCTNQPGPCICVSREWLTARADQIAREGGAS